MEILNHLAFDDAAVMDAHSDTIYELQWKGDVYPANVDANGNGYISFEELVNFANEKQGAEISVSDKGKVLQSFHLNYCVRD
jgi:hypothetical protein